MATAPSTTLSATSVMPSLTVDDVRRSLAFFEGLGFEVEERWEEKGALLGVMLKAGEVRIGLSQDDGKKGRDRVKGAGFRLYVEVPGSIDDIAARATAAGIPLTKPPLRQRVGLPALRRHRAERLRAHHHLASQEGLNNDPVRARQHGLARPAASSFGSAIADVSSLKPWSCSSWNGSPSTPRPRSSRRCASRARSRGPAPGISPRHRRRTSRTSRR